jgi:8-oxo-dGTP pyrophosphatase MutT (NUDIX family)/Zn ribbon nucleic-acid-binding protein
MVEYQKSAGFIIYYRDEEIKFLLLKYPHYWGFPKGIIEKDEETENTARRELEEETGIKNIEIIPGFENKQEWFFKLEGKTIKKQAVFFLAKTTEEEAGNVKVSSEHEDFAWLTYEDALTKLKIKNNKEMLEKANEFILESDKQKRLVFSEKTKKIEKGEGILENNNEISGFPHKCPKCGHDEADVVDLGAPYSDESNIYLFKCKKCGHVKRQADGSGNK